MEYLKKRGRGRPRVEKVPKIPAKRGRPVKYSNDNIIAICENRAQLTDEQLLKTFKLKYTSFYFMRRIWSVCAAHLNK